VEPGALLVANGKDCRVVLRLLQIFGRDAPKLSGANARWKAAGQLGAVDQPIGLGIGADERGGKELWHGSSRQISAWLGHYGICRPCAMFADEPAGWTIFCATLSCGHSGRSQAAKQPRQAGDRLGRPKGPRTSRLGVGWFTILRQEIVQVR